jgi:ferredoxin
VSSHGFFKFVHFHLRLVPVHDAVGEYSPVFRLISSAGLRTLWEMIVKIDDKKCIGCGLCAELCPAKFSMGDYVARVNPVPVTADMEDDLRAAAEDCPVAAISFEESPAESQAEPSAKS